MPHEVQARYPGLVIHQIEASVPEQYQRLIDGRLDVGVGRAVLAPPQIASLLFRRDPLGVLVRTGHPFAELDGVCIAALPGTIWRPLAEPASGYPWSVLWRAADDSGHVRAVVSCAQAMSRRLGWLAAAAIGLDEEP